MQPIDPALTTTLLALCVAALMVRAGIAKRRLEWRPRRVTLSRGRRRRT